MVFKIFFCSEFPDIPGKAGRKTRRRRTQAVTKHYAFHGNAVTPFFISNTFISNARLKLAKYQADAKQHFCYAEQMLNFCYLTSALITFYIFNEFYFIK